MLTRVTKAALEVIKEYALSISVSEIGTDHTLTIRSVPTDELKRNELAQAIAVWGGYDLNVALAQDNTIVVSAPALSKAGHRWGTRNADPIEKSPVGMFARRLADNGINYPGSEQYKSPQKQ
jgi:hypothetical protein